jgi:hypothetical protein
MVMISSEEANDNVHQDLVYSYLHSPRRRRSDSSQTDEALREVEAWGALFIQARGTATG